MTVDQGADRSRREARLLQIHVKDGELFRLFLDAESLQCDSDRVIWDVVDVPDPVRLVVEAEPVARLRRRAERTFVDIAACEEIFEFGRTNANSVRNDALDLHLAEFRLVELIELN